MFQIIN